MMKLTYTVLLSTALSLVSISPSFSMDSPGSEFVGERPLNHLPLNRESIEETFQEISEHLATSIEYSERKLEEIENIYQLYQQKKKAQARKEFNNLFGDGAAPSQDKGFLSALNGLKDELQNIIIYNAKSFLREINENIDGKNRYPRNFIGAGLIAYAAKKEIQDHKKTQSIMLKILEDNALGCSLAGKTEILEGIYNSRVEMAEDEIQFYSYLVDLVAPFFKESRDKNPSLFNQVLQGQINNFKALRLKHAEDKKKEEEAKKKEEEEKIKAQKLAKAQEAQAQSKPQGRGRGKARKGNPPIKKEKIQVRKLTAVISTPAATPIIEEPIVSLPSTPVEITDATSVTESILPIIPADTIDEQKLLPIMAIKLEDNHAPLETETRMDSQGAIPIVSPPPVIAKEEESVPLKEVPQIREDKHDVKPQNKEIRPLSIGLTYETTHIAVKYKELFKSMFNNNIPQNTIKWQSVMSMMQKMNGFKGKMYGSGGKRQFAVFLLEKQGEPTKFVTLQDYEGYLKDSKKVNLEYKIARKVAHTESPHTRGGAKGGARYMYPTLVKLFASSLEKIGLTPQTLDW